MVSYYRMRIKLYIFYLILHSKKRLGQSAYADVDKIVGFFQFSTGQFYSTGLIGNMWPGLHFLKPTNMYTELHVLADSVLTNLLEGAVSTISNMFSQ